MTKGVVPCPLPRIGGEQYSESQRLHLLRVPIHLALRAVPSRFINHPPGHPTTRATEITISYADLPLSRQIYRRPFNFFLCSPTCPPRSYRNRRNSAPISSRIPQESLWEERESLTRGYANEKRESFAQFARIEIRCTFFLFVSVFSLR